MICEIKNEKKTKTQTNKDKKQINEHKKKKKLTRGVFHKDVKCT